MQTVNKNGSFQSNSIDSKKFKNYKTIDSPHLTSPVFCYSFVKYDSSTEYQIHFDENIVISFIVPMSIKIKIVSTNQSFELSK